MERTKSFHHQVSAVEKDKLTSCIGHNYDADASGEDNHGDDDSPADGLVR